MPEGHLPVCSYLAVPVVSRSGEVLGGLFFGHEKPDVFTEAHERIVTGLAGRAAISMDTAKLFQTAEYARAQAELSARELTRSNSDLERFTFAVSHDLQEPLRMVTSHSQLLARKYKGVLDGQANSFSATFKAARSEWRLSLRVFSPTRKRSTQMPLGTR